MLLRASFPFSPTSPIGVPYRHCPGSSVNQIGTQVVSKAVLSKVIPSTCQSKVPVRVMVLWNYRIAWYNSLVPRCHSSSLKHLDSSTKGGHTHCVDRLAICKSSGHLDQSANFQVESDHLVSPFTVHARANRQDIEQPRHTLCPDRRLLPLSPKSSMTKSSVPVKRVAHST